MKDERRRKKYAKKGKEGTKEGRMMKIRENRRKEGRNKQIKVYIEKLLKRSMTKRKEKE